VQHPTHVYAALGAYTVTLTVGAGAESDTAVLPSSIRVVENVWEMYLPVVVR
jgi:PKD repeat protein